MLASILAVTAMTADWGMLANRSLILFVVFMIFGALCEPDRHV